MKKIPISIFIVILASCSNSAKDKTSIKNNERQSSKPIPTKTYQDRNNNTNNFLFLDYWSGMSPKDLSIINDSLLNNKIIFKDKNDEIEIRFDVGKEKIFDTEQTRSVFLNIRPVFEDNHLVQINLYKHKDQDKRNIQFLYFGYFDALNDIYFKKYGPFKLNISEPFLYSKKFNINSNSNYSSDSFDKYSKNISRIWHVKNKVIVISENYELKTDEYNGTYTPEFKWYSISYTTLEYYRLKEKREKDKKQEEKREIENALKESFDKI